MKFAIAVFLIISMPAHAGIEYAGCDDAADKVTLTACYSDALETADASLNETYKKVMPGLKEYEARAPDYEPKTSDILRGAQRAWIPFRDKACSAEAAAWDGTGASLTFVACKLHLTKQRTDDLKRIAVRSPE